MKKKSSATAPSSGQTSEWNAHADESALRARRRLLKLGAYVPPAIVGMAILGPFTASASDGSDHHHDDHHHCRPHHHASCMPSACRPCVDYDDYPREPDNNDRVKHERDRRECEIEKRKRER